MREMQRPPKATPEASGMDQYKYVKLSKDFILHYRCTAGSRSRSGEKRFGELKHVMNMRI